MDWVGWREIGEKLGWFLRLWFGGLGGCGIIYSDGKSGGWSRKGGN